jgi:hypothetical protein
MSDESQSETFSFEDNTMKILASAFVLLIPALSSTNGQATPEERVRHYRATVINLSADNRVSPFVAIVHDKAYPVFTSGMAATPGIQNIAEMGDATALKSELAAAGASVKSVGQASGGPLAPNESATVEFDVLESDIKQGALFTIVAMIGRSNDSFLAFKDVNISTVTKKEPLRFISVNYDAGTEENTGNREDFGSGGHPISAAEGHISFDRGLNLRGNAPETWAWGPNVARLTLEQL